MGPRYKTTSGRSHKEGRVFETVAGGNGRKGDIFVSLCRLALCLINRLRTLIFVLQCGDSKGTIFFHDFHRVRILFKLLKKNQFCVLEYLRS